MPLPVRKLWLLLIPVLLSSIQAETVLPSPPVIEQARITGRFLETSSGGVVLTFPGTELLLRFRGSEIRMRGATLSGENAFNLRLDGAPKPRITLPSGDFEVTLAEDLDPEVEHSLRLVRRNETWQGTLRLDAFITEAEGHLLPPSSARMRRLLCIGDSITCGQNTEFLPPYAAPGNANANAELTYGWVLAKQFDADLHLVSYGGRGIIRDWKGNEEAMTAAEFFEHTHADRELPLWDHARFSPDAILICLGTNDYAPGFVDKGRYIAAYRELVERVHAVHPEAKILLLSSPMLAGYAPDKSAALLSCLRAVQTSFGPSADRFLRVFELGAHAGTDWDTHPTGPQHAAMATRIAPILSQWLDWPLDAKEDESPKTGLKF